MEVFVFSSAGRANNIAAQKLSVCVSVCLSQVITATPRGYHRSKLGQFSGVIGHYSERFRRDLKTYLFAKHSRR